MVEEEFQINKNKDQFISYLNFEIDNLRNEIQSPGWTSWAIIGAIAGLIWLFIFEIEENRFLLFYAIGSLLIVWFIKYFYDFFRFVINKSKPSSSSGSRFILNHSLSNARFGLILRIFQVIFILVMIFLNYSHVNFLSTVLLFSSFSFLLLMLLFCLILTYLKLPIPSNPGKKDISQLLFLAFCGLLLVSIYYYIEYFFISPGGAGVFDVRFALIIASIFYLFEKYSDLTKNSPTLSNLVIIRRELSLDQIELDAAKCQTDIALSGYKINDILGENVTSILKLYREAESELKKCLNIVGELEVLLSKDVNLLSNEEKDRRHSLLVSLTSSVSKIRQIIVTDLPQNVKPFKLRQNFLKHFPQVENDLNVLISKIEGASKSCEQQLINFTEKYDKIYKIAVNNISTN